MKKWMVVLAVITLAACKKETETTPAETKIYWGNAIYSYGTVIRDNSTYQSFPDTVQINACLTLQPRTNNYQSYTSMIVGDTMDFLPVGDIVGGTFNYYYLHNLATPVKATFTSLTAAKIAPVNYNSIRLVRGTVTLSMDNFVHVEYTDSLLSAPGQTNHYTVTFEKHTQR